VHRMWGVHAYATMARAAVLALPAYWLAARVAGMGLVVLLLALGLITLAVAIAFVALGELRSRVPSSSSARA